MEEELKETQIEGSENPFTEKFEEFFKSPGIKKQIEKLIASYPEKKSLTIDFKELEQFDYQLADEILVNPDNVLQGARIAIKNVEVPALEIESFEPHIRFFNIPKDSTILIRDISAKHLNKLIAIEGVVRQFNQVHPKLKIALWKCKRCGNSYKIQQDGFNVKMPSMCECKHRDFELDEEQSTFINHQKIGIQESLERLKGSEQATTLDIHALDDLVNTVSPGDKTIVSGILRLYPPQKDKRLIYGRYLEALSVQEKEREFDEVEVTKEEEAEIRKLSKRRDVFEILRNSIAPSIYGHDTVKEAITLQLFSGVKKTLPGEMKVRGNIHILLVGDPGCLVADERIVLGNGAIEKIGNIGVKHLQELNMQVLTGEGGRKRDTATCFHSYKSQPVIEIISESGKSIKGTFNHPILCVSKENGRVKRDWKRLDEFKIGDKVATVTKIPCTITALTPTGFKELPYGKGPKFKGRLPKKLTSELGMLLGYMLGDGWVQKYRAGFVVAEPEKDILPRLLKASSELFGIKPSVAVKINPGRTVPLHYAIINSQNIAQNLSFLKEKRIPDLVLRSGNKVAAEFIKWLFEADGCVYNKGRGRRGVSLKAKNIELLRDVQILLLRFGVHSRIIENALQVRRGKDIIKFAQKIGFASKKKKTILKQLAKDARKFGRFNSQRSERIVKIIIHSLEDVFDIEVPKSRRFIANGIVSHNTAKSQMLQTVQQIAPKSIYTSGKTTSGVGLCVAPDTLILNENGFKEIREFVEENFDCKKAVEEIPSAFSNNIEEKKSACLGKGLKIEEKSVYKIWRIKAPEKMISLKTRSGKEIRLTPNTSLVRMKNSNVEWVKSQEICEGEFIAVARKIPEGSKTIHCAEVLSRHSSIRIKDNVAEEFTQITNILAGKSNCKLQELARKLGLKRERFYMWRSKKFYQSMPLGIFWKLGIEAGFEKEFLSGKITTVFSRYGKELKIPKTLNDRKLCYLAGLALGDGSLFEGKNTAQLRIWSADSQILCKIDETIKELFGLKAEKIKDHNGLEGRRIKYFEAIELLKELGLCRKENISLSHSATEQKNESLAELLSGLFDTDGYASNPKQGSASVGIGTISKKLAVTVQLALLKFWIQSKLRKRKKAGAKAFHNGILIHSRHDQYYIEIRGKNNLENFRHSIGFRLERKKLALEKIIQKISCENPNVDVIPEIRQITKTQFNPSREFLKKNFKGNEFLQTLSDSDVFWDEIIEKTEFTPGFEWVYDFSVREEHNFIANGFFVHNTASAEKDEFGEGGWTLKAGALVLASGGMAMVDEFDKMDTEDRSAMHEALEQGTISVAKAGIVTTFKTDTSVLAAANPKFSRFDPYLNPLEQVDLPATLVSRFDLFFLIKDVLDRKKDEEIATFILKRHQEGEIAIHEKTFKKKIEEIKIEKREEESIPSEQLKKYISFARQNIFPIMNDEALKSIREFYLGLRDMGRQDKVYTATHRQLEALVRLSEASARVRLKDFVEEEDTERAIRIFKASLEELALDKDTGKIDIDLITSGQAHSKTNQIKKILAIVNERTDSGKGNAPIDEIMRIAVTEGIDEDRARELITELKKKGDLYEPMHGWIKPTERKD